MTPQRLILEATIPAGFARQVIELPEHWRAMTSEQRRMWRWMQTEAFGSDAANALQVRATLATYCDSEIETMENDLVDDWDKRSQSYRRGWVEADHGGKDGRDSLSLYSTCDDVAEYEQGRLDRLAMDEGRDNGVEPK